MLQDSDLTPLERALCSAAAAGRLLDSRCRRSDEDDPAGGRAWGKDRQVRAQVLHQLLTGDGCLDQAFGQPLAVRLRGARVNGRLNLGGRTVRCPLELYGCYLGVIWPRLKPPTSACGAVTLRSGCLPVGCG
jgi:hypothetical protein